MLSGVNKVVSGVLLAGVTGGAGAYYFLSGSNEKVVNETKSEISIVSVSKKLSDFGYSVLITEGDENNAEWDKVLVAYNKIKQASDLFEGSKVAEDETRDQLKEKCKSALSLDSAIEKNNSLAKRWCVKEESITEMLKRNSYEKIGASTVSGNEAKWKEKATALKLVAQEKRSIQVALTGTEGDGKLLETACGQIKVDDTKTHANDFEENYIKAKDWCFSNTK